MEMALQVPPSQDKKRVKVYELRDNDWHDRGTGFCTAQMVNVSKERLSCVVCATCEILTENLNFSPGKQSRLTQFGAG